MKIVCVKMKFKFQLFIIIFVKIFKNVYSSDFFEFISFQLNTLDNSIIEIMEPKNIGTKKGYLYVYDENLNRIQSELIIPNNKPEKTFHEFTVNVGFYRETLFILSSCK